MKVLFACFSQSWGGMEMFPLITVQQLIKHYIKTYLVKKTVLLIQSSEKLKQFVVAARNRAVEMFDLEVFTQKLIADFEESLK